MLSHDAKLRCDLVDLYYTLYGSKRPLCLPVPELMSLTKPKKVSGSGSPERELKPIPHIKHETLNELDVVSTGVKRKPSPNREVTNNGESPLVETAKRQKLVSTTMD